MPLLYQSCFTYSICLYNCFLNHFPAASERPFEEGTHLLPVNEDVPEGYDSSTVFFFKCMHVVLNWWLKILYKSNSLFKCMYRKYIK